MHIEVFPSATSYGLEWHWHFRSGNRRIVADAEAFVTKANAIRAAKSVVRSVLTRCIRTEYLSFVQTELKNGKTRIHWG